MYKIVKARRLADKIFLMDVHAPRVASHCQPGQFIIVKMDEKGERIPLTICDYDNPNGENTYLFDMSEDDNFANLNAVEMGRLYKHNDGFKFQMLGSGYVGGMTELFKNFGLDIDEGKD